MHENATTIEPAGPDYIDMTADLVATYVSRNNAPVSGLADLIATAHAALAGLARPANPTELAIGKPTPAQIRKSTTPDALIAFEDGKPYKTLKQTLALRGLTPQAYQAK